MAKQKFYVVWDGAEDGVFTSWDACREAVSGYSNAKYKAFKTEEEAEEAFAMGWEAFWGKGNENVNDDDNGNDENVNDDVNDNDNHNVNDNHNHNVNDDVNDNDNHNVNHNVNDNDNHNVNDNHNEKGNSAPRPLPEGAINDAIAVDAACSGNPGAMEYRGVYLKTGKEIFHYGPVHGTNNIGEFLAIVHGLALLKQKGLHTMPVYSDSVNAQLWVRRKKCKTTLQRNEKTEALHQMIERAERWLANNTYANPIIKWPTEEWGEIPADFGRK